jgi:hypothetical protein
MGTDRKKEWKPKIFDKMQKRDEKDRDRHVWLSPWARILVPVAGGAE